MNYLLKHIALLMFSCLVLVGSSQEAAYFEPRDGSDGWSISAFTGLTQFYGDVNEFNFPEKFSGAQSQLHFGVGVGKEIKNWFTLRGQLFSSGLYSTQANFSDGRPADLRMQGNYYSFGADGKFHINPLVLNDYERSRRWQIYGVAGLGFATWNTELDDAALNETINQGTHSGAALNFGLGMDYRIYQNWNAMVEIGWRPVVSDKVDLVQGDFASDVPFHMSWGIQYRFSDGNSRKQPRRKPDRFEKQKEKPKKTEIAKTNDNDYQRLPGEGPDVLDFPQTGCRVTTRQTSKESTQQQDRWNRSGSGSASKTAGSQQAASQQRETRSYSSSGSNTSRQGVVFSVQILATSKPADRQRLEQQYNIEQPIREHRSGGIYRYVVGSLRHYDEAVSYSQQLQRKGIHDAFVVVFRNGKKISMTRELKNR